MPSFYHARGGQVNAALELAEIMGLSDRIYVIFEGKIVGEFQRGSMHDKHLGLLMAGGAIEHE